MQNIDSNELMSQAVIHNGVAHLSGQVDLENRDANFETQARNIFSKIDGILEKCSTSKAALISATIWLTDLNDFASFNELWVEWLDGARPPARATVKSDLVLPGLKLEIQVTAAIA